MKIKVDYSMAIDFKEFILNKDYESKEKCEQFVSELALEESFQKMMMFYKEYFTKEQYIDILFRALNLHPFKTDDKSLEIMYENFKRLRGRDDLIQKKIKLIEQYDFEKLKHLLESTLPKNTELEINIHFVFDGINGGSIVDKNTMLLYTMFWPSEEKNLKLIEGVLLHEYHHLGIKYWLDKDPVRKKIYSKKDNISLALILSDGILSEGSATYFFNKGHNIYPLILESHGEIFAQQYQESMDNRKTGINSVIKELENNLEKLISNKEVYDTMKEIVSNYGFSYEGKEPKDKVIGCYMCEIIEEVYGREELVKCFLNPESFIVKYNEAAKINNKYTFSKELINNWEKCFRE
jgi:hypothetical protein